MERKDIFVVTKRTSWREDDDGDDDGAGVGEDCVDDNDVDFLRKFQNSWHIYKCLTSWWLQREQEMMMIILTSTSSS